MFVWRQEGGGVILTMQTDHMAQAGDFGAAWGGDVFAPPRNRIAAIAAARNHDEGWRRWELRPEVNEDGLPVDFIDLPRQQHVQFYGKGVEFIQPVYPAAAVLVSRHATGLYLGRYGVDGMEVPEIDSLPPSSRTFVKEQEALQKALIDQYSMPEEDIWFDYRLLQIWDRLSICFCHGREDAVLGPAPTLDGRDVSIHVKRIGKVTLRLEPFPFDGEEQLFPVRTFEYQSKSLKSPHELQELLAQTKAMPTMFRAVR